MNDKLMSDNVLHTQFGGYVAQTPKMRTFLVNGNTQYEGTGIEFHGDKVQIWDTNGLVVARSYNEVVELFE